MVLRCPAQHSLRGHRKNYPLTLSEIPIGILYRRVRQATGNILLMYSFRDYSVARAIGKWLPGFAQLRQGWANRTDDFLLMPAQAFAEQASRATRVCGANTRA
jgi:hypothetical protein